MVGLKSKKKWVVFLFLQNYSYLLVVLIVRYVVFNVVGVRLEGRLGYIFFKEKYNFYCCLRILWTMKNFIFFQNLCKHTKSLSLPQTTNDIFSSFTLLTPTKILAFWQYPVTHYAGAFFQKSTVFLLYYNIYPHFTLLYFLKKYFFCT